MKLLGFNKKLVPLILEGRKITTWRLFGHHLDLKIGDTILLENTQTKEIFGKAKILSIKDTILGELTEEDKKEHEKFSNEEEMYKWYSKIYNKKVDKNTEVRIIQFKLIKNN